MSESENKPKEKRPPPPLTKKQGGEESILEYVSRTSGDKNTPEEIKRESEKVVTPKKKK